MKWRLSFLLLLAGLCALAHCLPRQYHFIDNALPWLDAQKYCRETFTDLATVEDIEEMNRLVNTAQDTTGGFTELAWIGLYLTSWRWSLLDERYYGDGEANYSNWDAGQPDNFLGNQLCVQMRGGGVWEDSECSLRSAFVCYDGGSDTFVLVEKRRPWFNAQRYCRRHHTDLASVRNDEENQRIQSLINNKSVWIGLYRKREWSDQSDSTYRYWKNGQPDNAGGQQNCTASDLGNAGLWSDERCSRALAFVCYGEKIETPQSITTMTPNTIISATGLSIKDMTSSDQPSTPAPTPASPFPEDLIELEIPLSSLRQDIRDLVVQFRNQLVALGLPNNIRVGLRIIRNPWTET